MSYEELTIIYAVSGVVGGLIVAIIMGAIASAIGDSKNYQGSAFALGFFLGILGIIIVAAASPGPSQEKQATDLGWTCSSCHTNNSNDSAFCKHCGAQRPKPTHQPTPNTIKICGTFKGDNMSLYLDDNSYKLYTNGTLFKSGPAVVNNNKVYLVDVTNNKKMELTVVQSNILVTSNGIVLKKL